MEYTNDITLNDATMEYTNDITLNDDTKPPAEPSIPSDDDDWSRQVETDETALGLSQFLPEDSYPLMESVILEGATGAETSDNIIISDNDNNNTPRHRELTLKEKLVMRERERRIETERARLKRQFALSNETTPLTEHAEERTADLNSVDETLGEESIVAHPDEESAEGRLGFNMERFLRNSDSFVPQPEEPRMDQYLLMNRFLNDASGQGPPDVTRSVSFDIDAAVATAHEATAVHREYLASAMASFGDISNTSGGVDASVLVQADEDEVGRDPLSATGSMDVQETTTSDVASSSASSVHATDEPRMLRLTEADMQEMAAIEDASIGNAPPSEREEMLSEIGELADFGSNHRHGHDTAGNFSVDTPTTAMESGSQISGNQGIFTQSDRRSVDGFGAGPTFSSDLVGSPGGSANDAVEAHPSSETARESALLGRYEIRDSGDARIGDGQQPVMLQHARLSESSIPTAAHENYAGAASTSFLDPNGDTDSMDHDVLLGSLGQVPLIVDGFDFDKHAPSSPLPLENDDSFRALPIDMGVSPLQPRMPLIVPGRSETLYGAIQGAGGRSGLPHLPMREMHDHDSRSESKPLLYDVPPEITTTRNSDRTSRSVERHAKERSLFPSVRSAIESALDDVRLDDEYEKQEVNQESEQYAASSMLSRGRLPRSFV
jgi:hypothetical protein